jgi:CRP/FNR family transcriptional regulator
MDSKFLKIVSIFSGLDDEIICRISEICKLKTYNEGDIIFFETEPYHGFYAVISGLVKIYKISVDGREHILHIIKPGNTFAEVPLFQNFDSIREDDFRYPANAMATEDNTQVISIPSAAFMEILQSDIRICMRMLAGLAKKLIHLNHHIEELTLKDVTRRVAGYIFSEYEKINRSLSNVNDKKALITLHITRQNLASYLGTAIETLSRTLGRLQSEGLIRVENRKIFVLEPEKLEKLTRQ